MAAVASYLGGCTGRRAAYWHAKWYSAAACSGSFLRTGAMHRRRRSMVLIPVIWGGGRR